MQYNHYIATNKEKGEVINGREEIRGINAKQELSGDFL